jgi:lipopolysaccharide/colanic/teichoic acid biosynthesis glycosyltransferase
MSRHVQMAIKRAFDFMASLIALVLLSPFMALIALAIWVTMGRPILFRQPRIGYRGRVFTIYKFRTMNDRWDEQGNLLPDEQRLTRLGRFLRSLTLDELPELFNVLKGEMSLVGPRPLLVEYVIVQNSAKGRGEALLSAALVFLLKPLRPAGDPVALPPGSNDSRTMPEVG